MCWKEQFDEVHLLKRHYVEKQWPENYFFKKLFTSQRVFVLRKPFLVFNEKLQKQSINFPQHSDFSNFNDPREIILESLQVFENRFMPRRNLERVRFKWNLTIIICQSPYANGFVELTDARVCVLDVYDGVYFCMCMCQLWVWVWVSMSMCQFSYF